MVGVVTCKGANRLIGLDRLEHKWLIIQMEIRSFIALRLTSLLSDVYVRLWIGRLMKGLRGDDE